MAFDFKKEYKEFYMPKSKPEIVTVPTANYAAVRGKGDPNEKGGAYQKAIGILYTVAYTIRMSYKGPHQIEGFYEYVVPPLEGFWSFGEQGSNGEAFGSRGKEAGEAAVFDKSQFQWISVIRLPDFVTRDDLEWAKQEAGSKKKMDCSSAEFYTVDEGLCVQIMHIGSYDNEAASIAQMDQFLFEHGYEYDISDFRLQHEIYLSEARRVAPEKWKTVIRHPIRERS
ncbi:MAG: GyrI-like domain-containing protein [Lachnospiraceae bacterium]|nr:GyrI-like domain-containing protein [Lachnospiraceae bacterium]